MLAEFIDKILAVSETKLHDLKGETYSDKPLLRVKPHIDKADTQTVNSLSALCQIVKSEVDSFRNVCPLFVNVKHCREIEVFSTFEQDLSRQKIYAAVCDTPSFSWERYKSHEEAIIALQSRFVQNEGTTYLLDILSKITLDNGVSSSDNGVTQQVEIKKGVALKDKVKVKPFVNLVPYRTFLEVVQPTSKMLLRVNNDAEILLTEADGGMWQVEAKFKIKEYLDASLKSEIEAGKVIVLA